MTCPDEAHLLGLLEGSLRPHETARLDGHLDRCPQCRALVVQLMLARATMDPPAAPGLPGPAATGTLEVAASEGNETTTRVRFPRTSAGPRLGRRYVVSGLVGQGGMGRVHRAMDRLTGREVALKHVPFELHARDGSELRTLSSRLDALAQEFRVLATLRHPNIISVLDYGFDAEKRPFFTMELLEGARPVVPFATAAPRELQVDLLVQLLRALAYLHRRGLLHRDIKPSNLLVTGAHGPSPALKVLDFGLSATSDDVQRTRAAGTPTYMAPELFRGGSPSAASDLYAVGVLAYEMFAGHHPFQRRGSASDLVARVLATAADLTPISPPLRPLIGRALSKLPEARPASAAAFLGELASATGSPPPSEPAAARDSYLVAANLVGREHELDELRRALDEVRLGRGSTWLVGGESGVGKSRLLDELRTRALVDGVYVACGQAAPTGGTAYSTWRDVLEVLALHVELSDVEANVLGAVLPGLNALLDRELLPPAEVDMQVTRYRLLHVLRDVVERSRTPVLILLEDLQWADAESLALLAQVSADAGTLPLLVVASYRDDEAPRLPQVLPAMRALPLPRLDRKSIALLCESMLGAVGRDERLVDLVARETEGNTYFIVEAMRALAEESGGLGHVDPRGLPERILAGGVEHMLERRLARVPREARALLRLAAIAGRALDTNLLGRLVPQLDGLVQACAEAGVLAMHEQRWRFDHDKLRERVLAELSPADKVELHARVAAGLVEAYGDDADHAGSIARHYREAQRPAAAVGYYERAGEAALHRGAPAEALAMLEQASALQDVVGATQPARVRVWRGIVQARFGLGQLRETDTALRRLCELAGSPLPGGPLRSWRMIAQQAAIQIARRTGLASLLSPAPRNDDEKALRTELLAGLAAQEVYVWLAEPQISVLITLWGLNLEETFGVRHQTAFHAGFAFLLSYTPLRALGQRYLDEASRMAPAGSAAELDCMRVQTMMWINGGVWHEGLRCAERVLERARTYRDDLQILHSLFLLQLAVTGLDDHHRLLAVCLEMEDIAARIQNPRYLALGRIGRSVALLNLGDFAASDAAISGGLGGLPHELGPVLEAVALGVVVLCAERQGQKERADELARSTMAVIRRIEWTMLELRYPLLCVLDVYLSSEHPERRIQEITEALTLLHRVARTFSLAEPTAWLSQGRFDLLQGQPARAARSLRRSLRAAERVGARYEQARARYFLGRLAQTAAGARHVPEGATPHLRAALNLYEQMDEKWEAARTRDAMAGGD